MEESVTGLLDTLRPPIKKHWEALLRAKPVVSPLASPDLLVRLMDETLDQLIAAVRTRSVKAWPRRSPLVFAPLQERCVCGINPLLAYYSTGRVALCRDAGKKLGPAIDDVLWFYHRLAQEDVDALCGVCCHRDSAACARPRHALVAARNGELLSGR